MIATPGMTITEAAIVAKTPPELFAACERRFGRHTVDLAATAENSKCSWYLGPGSQETDDALTWAWDIMDFGGGRGFLNPGFKRMTPWVRRSIEAKQSGKSITMVCLPSLETAWSRLAIKHADVYHLWPRVPFIDREHPEKTANDRNTMILDFTPGRRRSPCLWNWKTDEITEFA